MPPIRKSPKATSSSSSSVPDSPKEETQPIPTIIPQYVVNFSNSESDRALLSQIEETLAQHKAIDFSDLCKEALQQLLAPEASYSPSRSDVREIDEEGEVAASPLLQEIQQQVNLLEAKIAALPGIKRFEYLESLVISLERKVDGLSQGETGGRSTPKPQGTNLELDPLLSRLSNLLEDF